MGTSPNGIRLSPGTPADALASPNLLMRVFLDANVLFTAAKLLIVCLSSVDS